MDMGGEEGLQTQHSKRDFSEDAVSASNNASPTDANNSDSNSNNKKRRTGTSTSSRGVANLTPDQLQKKRANDREAQRAIRERTKNQIENLERKIRDLTSQQPYQELQHVIRQKELVEADNADIKKRLASVLSIIQPVLGPHALEAPNYTPPAPSYVPNRPGSSSRNMSTPSSATSPAAAPWQAPNAPMGHHEHRNYTQAQDTQTQLNQQRYDMAHNLDMGPERLGLDFLLDGTQRINKIPNGIHGPPECMSFQHGVAGSERGSPGHNMSNPVGSNYNTGSSGGDMVGHAVPIRNSPPTCPLDSLLLDFLHSRQVQAADGVATPKLVGPAYPSVSSLLNPAKSAQSHPLSKVFTDILATFPDLSTLPEKVAVLYIIKLRPTPRLGNAASLSTLLPPPSLDRSSPLSQDARPPGTGIQPTRLPLRQVVHTVHHNDQPELALRATDTLLSSPESDELMINPVFERHLRRLENWSLGPAFAKAFPGLNDTYRLKTDGDRRP
ncbi:hypothetical protein LOCC1_G001929 [Lachnellula occidentalis]|uniref:BZIP domain-containing protein n=1 Tax=Lachnellula occidentalis TaxID=215460 RepID=A0A8H8UK31_9HELO|nr:hypothetical protein LOCC1_G001929 [Lachnellula occidentalis]